MKLIGIIVNPLSGDGRGASIWNEIETYLQLNHISYLAKVTTKSGEATEHAITLVQEHRVDKLIVIGGDGTIHEAAGGLWHIQNTGLNCPLAVIPAGTGNDFAKAYGIPTQPIQALEAALSETTKVQIDLLRTKNGMIAVNSIGAGFDGMVAKLTNEAGYKKFLNRIGLGKLSYFISILRVFATYQPSTAWLEVDGTVHELPNVADSCRQYPLLRWLYTNMPCCLSSRRRSRYCRDSKQRAIPIAADSFHSLSRQAYSSSRCFFL